MLRLGNSLGGWERIRHRLEAAAISQHVYPHILTALFVQADVGEAGREHIEGVGTHCKASTDHGRLAGNAAHVFEQATQCPGLGRGGGAWQGLCLLLACSS